MRSLVVCLFWLGCLVAAVYANAAGDDGKQNYPYSNTPIRVLLHRSAQSLSVQSVSPANVRIDGETKRPKLSAGITHLGIAGDFVVVVRFPYAPLRVRSFELLWPSDRAGFLWNKKPYYGRILIQARSGALLAINSLGLERYLAATVGAEMVSTWSLEALKAQAVAARTYAIYRLEHPRDPLYDIDSTVEDQVYPGASGETATTWNAVKQTAGLYLAGNKGPVKAYFHSRCGGVTGDARRVWGTSAGTRQGVPCAYCRSSPYRWKARWSQRQFLSKLGLPPGPIAAIVPTKTDGTRVLEVEVSNGKTNRTLSADSLRRALGYERLKSTQFAFQYERDEVVAEGTGAGHGVGMCQWGAKYLAEKGASFQRILSHYFPEDRLRHYAAGRHEPRRLRFSTTQGIDRDIPSVASR